MPEFVTEQLFPLTKQQQGLWIEWKLHPENTSYNTCVKVKLKGKVDTNKLGQALKDIVQYFDSLKVYFVEKSGIPYQCIKDEGTYFLNYNDISIKGQNETPEQAQLGLDFLSQTLNTPIDLKVFPIVRASLMKVADETYYFIGMVPHIISDGRSAVLFLESLSIAYNNGYQGLCEAYGSTIKGWSDFHEDKRNQFDAEKHALSKQHWQERLAGANHYHDYSYGRKNTSKDDKQGHRVYFDIPSELAKAVKAHTGKNRTTLFNVMVCAFGIFINRYFSLKDILIGFPISIRPPGYKHLFGFFVNIVPIRVDLSGDPTYQELLERVSISRKEDKSHQKFPALDIVNAVRENITNFDGQLFNLSMAQTVSRLFNLELEGIETEPLESEYNDVNDDLSLSYELLEDGIGLWFEYRTSMFDEDFIDQGIQHIRQILEQITTAPDTPLSQFKLLSQSQEDEVLSFSQSTLQKQTNTIKPSFTHFIDSFERQVSNTPEAIALHFLDEVVSYAQLNKMANQLARQLITTGVKATDKIAVCLNRGPQLISSLLAVLKTGCAYIPIAPDYPKQRLQFILEDTHCNYIIYEDNTAASRKGLTSKALNLNETVEQRRSLNANNLDTDINGQDTAYIIYTSGSTGKPKGVVISHANLIPRLDCLQKEIPLSETDVMLQNTDFSFDVSVAEIFWPLTTGASLALVAQQDNKYPDRLLKMIDNYQVTTSCMVPSLLNALLSIATKKELQPIKYLLAAGEVISSLTVQHFYQLSAARLYNFYGPTEATIYATFYYCRANDNINYVPIGKPLLNTETYILDEYKQVQAKGVAGELYLAGKGVSSGYLNRQHLNVKTFIDNPFYSEFSDSAKLYRTGDKARYLSDGNIDFLGRIDQQVKIRGYRIEVAEIEVNLSTVENIKDCTVNIDITDSYQQRLIAYFVRSNKTDGSIHDESFIKNIRQQLSEKLPRYMLPSLFIALDEIPRSQSGKVLKNQLPSVSNMVKETTVYTPAETKIEKQLVDIWANILKLPASKIGIHDSFFELGGDSLMAIQFASAAEEQSLFFDTDSLFESRTIAELANIILETKNVKQTAEISQQTVDGEFPLTARQYKFFDDNFINPHHWNRQFSFDVEKKISLKALEKSFTQVLSHHDALRVYFLQKKTGEWVQVSSPIDETVKIVFKHDLSKLSSSEQQAKMRLLIEQVHQDIRTDRAPLIRAIYFKIGKKSGHIVIVSHHLLLDMISSRIVFEDLMKCYEYRGRGLTCKLPKKTSSLKQWTEYLSNYSNNGNFQSALEYWGNFPLKSAPVVPISPNFNDRNNTEESAKTITLKLPLTTTTSLLKDLPSSKGYKIQDLLLTALLAVTKSWTHDDALTVNICGHGRSSGQADINLSRTVGWVNTVFPVRLNASGVDIENSTQLITTVNQQLSKVPSNNMDYNILRYITRHPEITQHPSPEIFFNYVGQIDAIVPDNIAFKPSKGLQGIAEIDGDNHLCYLLYFEAGVTQGELHIRLTYSENAFSESVIKQLSQSLIKRIEIIVEQQLFA